MIVDSHCHLDFEDYGNDRAQVLARARESGVDAFVCVGSGQDLAAARGAVALAAADPDVWATVGIHPHDAGAATDEVWLKLDALVKAPRVVGVGETGLDYHYDRSPRPVQQAAFRRFVALARAAALPLVCHVRNAHADAAAVLREEGAAVGGVIHCFTGTMADARVYLDLGQHLSFSGMLTFKSADELRRVAGFAPLDRILVETDAPFLAPVPLRGKRNEPAFIVETVRALASVRGLSFDETARVTAENARRLFGLRD